MFLPNKDPVSTYKHPSKSLTRVSDIASQLPKLLLTGTVQSTINKLKPNDLSVNNLIKNNNVVIAVVKGGGSGNGIGSGTRIDMGSDIDSGIITGIGIADGRGIGIGSATSTLNASATANVVTAATTTAVAQERPQMGQLECLKFVRYTITHM